MSYIPDYRKETDKLNEDDKAIINAYRVAIEDMMCFFDNIDDDEALSVEKEVTEKVKARLKEWMDGEEIMLVCSLFDNAEYLPEDIELVDANKAMFGK
jgi:hypothetical protein